MEDSEQNDEQVPFTDLPPKERLELLLYHVHLHKEIMKDQDQSGVSSPESIKEHWQKVWSDITEEFVDAVRENPSIARESYSVARESSWGGRRRSEEMPLLHWMCRLDCDPSLVRKVHEIAGEELWTSSEVDPPLHVACRFGASIELISFLLGKFPESARTKLEDQFPLGVALSTGHHPVPMFVAGQELDPFDENERRLTLFRLLSEGLKDEEILDATRVIHLSWDGTAVKGVDMPLGLMLKVAKLHGCECIKVKAGELTRGCDIEINGRELVCEVQCSSSYDFALEQLLLMPLPIKVLEAEGLYSSRAILYLINALDPPQEDKFANDEEFLQRYLTTFKRPYQPRPMPPPLDLSTVEELKVDAVIDTEDTLINLIKAFRRLPNLKEFHLSGFTSIIEESQEISLTACFFRELSNALKDSINLKALHLHWVEGAAFLFTDFLSEDSNLERVTFESPDPLQQEEVDRFTALLRKSKSIKYLKLGPLTEGSAEHIANAVKDGGSILEEFVGEGVRSRGRQLPFDSSLVDTCLLVNKEIANLSGPSLKKEDAYQIWEPYFQNTSVLYPLLRYRPELWCDDQK